MIFNKTNLKGAHVIDMDRREDDRGFFARSWCRREFEAHGLNPNLVQCNISFSHHQGTLRGMHYQTKPFEEAKLVRCTRGSLCDVIVDLRPDSPSYKSSLSIILTSENRRMLYVPEGFAHGFITLENGTEVFYQMSEFYMPEYQRGFRWDDPAFALTWPAEPEFISERDRNFPDFSG